MGVQDVLNTGTGAASGCFREVSPDGPESTRAELDADLLERDMVRVGVEQEMFLVDRAYRLSPIASEVPAQFIRPQFHDRDRQIQSCGKYTATHA